MSRRRPKPEEEKLLDHLSRTVNPAAEDHARLVFTLENDPVAREAFAKRYAAMQGFVEHARHDRERLPRRLAERLDKDLPRVKSYEELRAAAERKGEEPPQLELHLTKEEEAA